MRQSGQEPRVHIQPSNQANTKKQASKQVELRSTDRKLPTASFTSLVCGSRSQECRNSKSDRRHSIRRQQVANPLAPKQCTNCAHEPKAVLEKGQAESWRRKIHKPAAFLTIRAAYRSLQAKGVESGKTCRVSEPFPLL